MKVRERCLGQQEHQRLLKASLGAGGCFTAPLLSLLQSGHSTQWKRSGFILDPGLSQACPSTQPEWDQMASFSRLQDSVM